MCIRDSTFVYLHNPGAAYYAHNDNNWKRLAEQSELVTTFTGLSQTPGSFASGDAGKFVKVNSSNTALEFVAVTTGATNFTGLSDTPSSFASGDAGKFVKVNSSYDALEFVTVLPSFASGDAGKFVKVNSSYNALEFISDPGYLTAIDIVNDQSPQLGGDLDVNNKKITSSGGGDIDIEPNGTGVVEIRGAGGTDGTLQLNCSAQSHGVKIKSPAHSAAASYTLTLPVDIQANKILTTDANGQTSWTNSAANLTSIPAANITGTLPAIDGSNLTGLQAGATGGNSGGNAVFWENQQTVTHDYSISANRNAGSFGPITINSGITVTVPSTSNWTIV